ncbi:MAG: glutamate--cysteine ligase [Deltaproteobacteria bacterium]|nr:glutamate--cysteine ligase [Deltaproteobacteria bacterium]
MASSNSAPLTSLDQLLEPFHEAQKPRARWKIGTEAEKCGVYSDGSPVPYLGERGVAAVLADLVKRHGWFEEREHQEGDVIALRRGDASVTLEPGAQLELSGAPLTTIHETCSEFRAHLRELEDISEKLDIQWLGLGFHPFAKTEDLEFVPKLRYGVMRQYLPTRGKNGLDMMLRTCTVQANLDYANEEDAIRKLRVSLRLQPIVTAMFANSPFVEGKITGERSHRARVWLDVDNDRSGLLDFAWEDSPMGYRRYIEWVLDVPMFLVKRDGKVVHNTGQTFRRYLAEGWQGVRATQEDWVTHVNSMFPEVRLKRTLEMRGADSLPTDLVCALPALWKGLLYEDHALAAAESLASKVRLEDAKNARADIADHALRAKLGERDVGEWASDVLRIAQGGLERLSNLNKSGEDERIHLARLESMVNKGQSPADALLEKIDPKAPLVPQVLAHAHL